MERKKREKHFNCFWTHNCRETEECCHFCKKKNCEWRCLDNHNNCKYKNIVTEDTVEQPSEVMDAEIENQETVTEVVKDKPNVARLWGG